MIDAHLITGRLGSGKTSLIKYLRDNKPANEHWAIIINEFGEIGLDTALLDRNPQSKAEAAEIIDIPGGCICCTTATVLRVKLTEIIRKIKPTRIFIEATGLGHPAGIVDILRQPEFSDTLQIKPVINIIDLSLFDQHTANVDRSPLATDLFIQQIEIADIIILNKKDIASDNAILKAHNLIHNIHPSTTFIFETSHGIVDLDILQQQRYKIEFNFPHHHANRITTDRNFLFNNHQIHFASATESQFSSYGWILAADVEFDRLKIKNLLISLSVTTQWNIIRVKAVFNCGKFWYSFNVTDKTLQIEETSYRRDNRIELLTENTPVEPEDIFSQLMGCLKFKS